MARLIEAEREDLLWRRHKPRVFGEEAAAQNTCLGPSKVARSGNEGRFAPPCCAWQSESWAAARLAEAGNSGEKWLPKLRSSVENAT
jgi:hypothetical protein